MKNLILIFVLVSSLSTVYAIEINPEIEIGCLGYYCDGWTIDDYKISYRYSTEFEVCEHESKIYPFIESKCVSDFCLNKYCEVNDRKNSNVFGIIGCTDISINCQVPSDLIPEEYSIILDVCDKYNELYCSNYSLILGVNIPIKTYNAKTQEIISNDTIDDNVLKLGYIEQPNITLEEVKRVFFGEESVNYLNEPFIEMIWCIEPSCKYNNLIYTKIFDFPQEIMGYQFSGLNVLNVAILLLIISTIIIVGLMML